MNRLSHYFYLVPVLLFLSALFVLPVVSVFFLLHAVAYGSWSGFHATSFWYLWLFAVCACYLRPVFEQQ